MISRRSKIAIWLILHLTPVATLAAEPVTANQHIAGAESPVTLSYLFQILASFAVVILFILALAWLMRKTGRFGPAGNKSIKLLSSLSLGMREKIVVVNVEGTSIVVGVAPGQIRTLHVLEGTHAAEDVEVHKDEEGFARIMGKFLK